MNDMKAKTGALLKEMAVLTGAVVLSGQAQRFETALR